MIKKPTWFCMMFCLVSGAILFSKGNAQSAYRFTAYNTSSTGTTATPVFLCSAENQRGSNNSNEKILREDFTVFPNSNKGNVTLKYYTQRSAAFQIYDASGRLMFFRLLDQGENLVQMRTSLPEGVYIYTINDKGGTVLKTAKLVVVK